MSDTPTFRCARCFKRYEEDTFADKLGEDEEKDDELVLCGTCEDERNAEVEPLDIEATFGPGGPLSAGNPAYEARPGQVRLARAIHDALVEGRHLLGEGPCGIGKSKAYGVPAAHLAAQGKRVMIVTASIALQEQLVKKDLPALAKEMPRPFTFELMKGRGNYLCLEQQEVADSAGLIDYDRECFHAIASWSKKTTTGDRSELLLKPSDLVWRRFSVSSDECPRRKCPAFDRCWATKARERASDAGILVTNYHLFFLNLASGGQILPSADVVILDEAHEAADIAREFLGGKISEGTFKRIANDAAKRGAVELADELREAAGRFFSKLIRFHDSGHYSKLLRWPLPFDAKELEELAHAYAATFPRAPLAVAAERAARTIVDAVAIKDPDCVYSIEVSGQDSNRRAALVSRYVQPGKVLTSLLWGGYQSVVALSATLTTDGKFDFARQELGAPADAREIVVETPFNFPAQAMLVVPPASELPEPNDPAFLDVAARRVIETIEACGGRTLGLFTSYRAVNAVYDRVRQHFGGRFLILRQGDAPPSVLTQKFKDDVRSVLLGTTSFWTGIDVPGEALTGVVIDRLPFGSPDDPVTIRMGEQDRSAFARYTVPKAILTMRQGVGRLIRSQRDVGAIVLLDRRITTKGYGTRFTRSLPPMTRAQSAAAIAPFLRSRGVAA